jgi:dCMP deaminase
MGDSSPKQEIRPGWDRYFLDIAKVVASRSTCFRNKVGAVIAKDKAIISTGYNGSPKYQRSCQDIGFCYRDLNKIESGTRLETCRAVGSHAESNAIALAARNGAATSDATIYITGHSMVCNQCKAILANAGITRVVLEKPTGEIIEYFPIKDWTIHPIDQTLSNQNSTKNDSLK